jgi:tRNA pseudouridine38-40 synthase
MRNIKLIIQYDGTDYSGWQVQVKETTIQGLLEKALFTVSGEQTRIKGSGRTDAGVHAFEQVAAFSTGSDLEPDVFVRAFNANLPNDIRVISAENVSEDFDPRYNAANKTYSYLISGVGPYSVSACYLIGKHDFSSFRASGCSSKNPVRKIISIKVQQMNYIDFMSFRFEVPIIKISIQANAFLRHMARNIVGTLFEIGRGKIQPEKIKDIIEAKDRRKAGKTAPACGLFLEKIEY